MSELDDTLPLDDLYAEREQAILDQQWSITLTKGIKVDASGQSLDTAAAGGAAMPKSGEKAIQPAVDSRDLPPELNEPVIRRVLDDALKAITGGTSLDEVERHVREGTLEQLMSRPGRRGAEAGAKAGAASSPGDEALGAVGGGIVGALAQTDVIPNTFEAVARKTATDQQLAPELVDKIGTTAGIVAAMMLPPGGGVRRVAKVGAEAAQVLRPVGRQAVDARKLAGLSKEAAQGTLAGANINLARVNAERSTKGTMAAINALHAEKLAGARKTVTHGQTVADAGRAGLTLDDALRLDTEKFDLRAVQLAVRDYHNAAATHLDDLVKKTLSGDEAAGNQLWDAFTIAGELSMRDELLGKVAARALESRKILSEAERAAFDPAMLSGLAQTLKGAAEGDALLLAKRLDALSKTQQQEFARQMAKAVREGKPSLLFEIWMNWGLLSNPPTHGANIGGSVLTTMWAIPERLFSALASQGEEILTLGRHPRTVFYGEAAALLFGDLMAQKQAIRAVGKAFRTGVSGIGPEKVELGAQAAKLAMLQGDNPLGHAAGFWATAWRAPTRFLTAEDAYFKWVNYTAEMWAQGYREAALQGKHGRAFADEMFRIVRERPTLASQRAEDFALMNTVNREIADLGNIGRFGGGLLDAIRALPGGRFIAAFKRTPVNVMHYAVERTPILNAFADTLRADLAAGGERRALAMGKVMGGASLASVVSWYTMAGLFTGAGPRDPNQRDMLMETGWLPCSIKIGGTYYRLNRLDPMGAMICTAATATEIAAHLPDYRLRDVATGLALALARNMTSKTYLEGPSNLLDALERPERDAGKILTSLERTLVPAIVRGAKRVVDPTLRETTARPDAAMRELDEFFNELRANIPGLSSSLPPRRNLFGEPVILPGVGWSYDMLSPVYVSPTRDDPVATEIARLKLSLTAAPRTIYGRRVPRLRLDEAKPDEGVELTPNEYDQFVRLAGNELKANGKGMKDTLADLITTSRYRDQSDEMKRVLISQVVMLFREAARAKLLDDNPGLEEAVIERIRTRAESLAPPSSGAGGLTPSLGR